MSNKRSAILEFFVKECVNVILFACLMCLSKLCPRPSIVSRSSATMVAVQEVVEDAPSTRPLTARSSGSESREIRGSPCEKSPVKPE